MKTLVIHPTDKTTDFLKPIYEGKDWTVINTNVSKRVLKDAIKAHDRIVMLGHGTSHGLIMMLNSYAHKFIIDSNFAYLLRQKECVCIWCNADKFVTKYGLKGFYTGMIVSEMAEADIYILHPVTEQDITESNLLFTESIKQSIDKPNALEIVKDQYQSDSNNIILFNMNNVFCNV